MATLEVRPARSRHPSRLRLRQQPMARRRKATSTPTTQAVHFVRSQFAALMLFEFLFLYPDSRFFAVYDNATVLCSKGAYALGASIMSLSPGGKQRKQRDTTYTVTNLTGEKVKQSLVDTHGCLLFCRSVANYGPRDRRRSRP